LTTSETTIHIPNLFNSKKVNQGAIWRICRLCADRNVSISRKKNSHSFDGQRQIRTRRPISHFPYLKHSKTVQDNEGKVGLHDESYGTQLMISDLFVLIESYNQFISFYVRRYIAGWAVYAFFTISWLLIPREFLDSVKLECYLFNLLMSFTTSLGAIRYAMVHRRSLRLYNLMCFCMALEDECHDNKLRWAKLTRLYYPVPMHCFRMSQKIELSPFSGFKLLGWIFSVMILSVTFFNYFV